MLIYTGRRIGTIYPGSRVASIVLSDPNAAKIAITPIPDVISLIEHERDSGHPGGWLRPHTRCRTEPSHATAYHPHPGPTAPRHRRLTGAANHRRGLLPGRAQVAEARPRPGHHHL